MIQATYGNSDINRRIIVFSSTFESYSQNLLRQQTIYMGNSNIRTNVDDHSKYAEEQNLVDTNQTILNFLKSRQFPVAFQAFNVVFWQTQLINVDIFKQSVHQRRSSRTETPRKFFYKKIINYQVFVQQSQQLLTFSTEKLSTNNFSDIKDFNDYPFLKNINDGLFLQIDPFVWKSNH